MDGIRITSREEKSTVTFAAPVELNGIRGNMAATVILLGKKYYTHRIMLPNGKTFSFDMQTKEAVREPLRGASVSGPHAYATSTASEYNVSEKSDVVNIFSEKSIKNFP